MQYEIEVYNVYILNNKGVILNISCKIGTGATQKVEVKHRNNPPKKGDFLYIQKENETAPWVRVAVADFNEETGLYYLSLM